MNFRQNQSEKTCIVHCTRVCIDKNKQMWATGGNQSVGSLGRFILETYISFRALHTHNSLLHDQLTQQLPFGKGG